MEGAYVEYTVKRKELILGIGLIVLSIYWHSTGYMLLKNATLQNTSYVSDAMFMQQKDDLVCKLQVLQNNEIKTQVTSPDLLKKILHSPRIRRKYKFLNIQITNNSNKTYTLSEENINARLLKKKAMYK